jgi:[ribosomal protein S18]-alanine N-acetyltransferase
VTNAGSDSAAAVAIRQMRAADIDQVMAIADSLKDAPHWPASAYMAALDQSGTPRRMALVAANEPAGGIVGFAVASLLPPQAELESIAVRLDAQRQGIGSQLLRALTGELKAAGINEFLLEVRASNHAGLAFYQSHGWQRAGVRPRYYADPEEDAVLMSRMLG